MACRDLRRRAAAVMEGHVWHDVYHLFALQSSSGAAGWLYHFYGEPWRCAACRPFACVTLAWRPEVTIS